MGNFLVNVSHTHDHIFFLAPQQSMKPEIQWTAMFTMTHNVMYPASQGLATVTDGY